MAVARTCSKMSTCAEHTSDCKLLWIAAARRGMWPEPQDWHRKRLRKLLARILTEETWGGFTSW
jgi:hypothetical protein